MSLKNVICIASLFALLTVAALSLAPEGWTSHKAGVQAGVVQPVKDENPLDAPLGGLRQMLKAMDALIAAFQQDSELFTKLVEVYQAGGPLWDDVEACIEQAYSELQEGQSI